MSLRSRLRRQLKDRQFRHAYADEQLNLSIGTQIKAIREQQKMSQAALAERIGTKQAGISRIESANYNGWSIALLRRIAMAFDVRLRVSFEEFGTLWKEVDEFDRTSLERRKFDDDPEFGEGSQEKTAAVSRIGEGAQSGASHSMAALLSAPHILDSAIARAYEAGVQRLCEYASNSPLAGMTLKELASINDLVQPIQEFGEATANPAQLGGIGELSPVQATIQGSVPEEQTVPTAPLGSSGNVVTIDIKRPRKVQKWIIRKKPSSHSQTLEVLVSNS